MKLQVLSDLHLEFSDFTPPETDADVIVLAGDIGKGVDGIRWARKAFPNKEIVIVAGNHEFYGSDREDTLLALRITAIELGIHLLENSSIDIDGVRFLGCTLWTDFKLFGDEQESYCLQTASRNLNDFRIIREGNRLFTPKRSQELHTESLNWLKSALDDTFSGKTVIVTHHLPSMLSVTDKYASDPLSACFASRLDELFGKYDLHCHGHTHTGCDYWQGRTHVVCNPRGYVRNGRIENKDFNPSLIVEI